MKNVFGLVCLALASNAFANLFSNGSFENPVIAGSQNDGQIYYAYDLTGLTDWASFGNVIVARNVNSYWKGTDGSQYINLQFSTSNYIEQTIATVAGGTYRIKFDLSCDNLFGQWNRDDCTLGVSLNGTTLNTFKPSTDAAQTLTWDSISLDFTATSSSSSIRFFDAANFTNFVGPMLDNVSVEAVPEPASILALTFGSFALIVNRKRRK